MKCGVCGEGVHVLFCPLSEHPFCSDCFLSSGWEDCPVCKMKEEEEREKRGREEGVVLSFSLPNEEGESHLTHVSFLPPHPRSGETMRKVGGKWKLHWEKEDAAVTRRVAARHLISCKTTNCNACLTILKKVDLKKEKGPCSM